MNISKLSKLLLVIVSVLFASCQVEPIDSSLLNQINITGNNQNPNLPSLTTNSISSITNTTANSGGVITLDGGSPITERGVVWSINQNPTTSNSKTNDGSGIGNFTSTLTGLVANTTYYVRAYATNANGTAYGNEVSFTTASVSSSLFMAGTFNGTAMSNMRPTWYGGSFGGTVEVDVNNDHNGDRYLQLQGDGLNGLQLNIWIPESQWQVGTYNLFDHDTYGALNSNAWLIQNLSGVSSTDITSGTITILEFNLTSKKIRGTFSFTYYNFMVAGGPNQGPYQVTNGTFDYKLNDPYFN